MDQRLISGTVRVVAFAAALLLLTVLVVSRSEAAFTATTSNPTSGFSAGTIALSDDDANTAMFNLVNMVPATPASSCITVTYSGSVPNAPVRLYGTSSGALAQYLDVTVQVGTGGSFGNCAAFTPSSTLYTGTLAAFSSGHTNWATGIAAFTAASNPTSEVFKVTVTVEDNNAAQGLTATSGFTWESQNP
jgi:hypothetical protein